MSPTVLNTHINKHVSMVASADGAFLVVKCRRVRQPWSWHRDQTGTPAFDLLVFFPGDQSQLMQFSTAKGTQPERKSTTSVCPHADASLRDQWEGPQCEADSVTKVCLFSTGNCCVSLISQDQELNKKLSCWYRHTHSMTFRWVNDLGPKQTERVTCGKCPARCGTNFWLHCLDTV